MTKVIWTQVQLIASLTLLKQDYKTKLRNRNMYSKTYEVICTHNLEPNKIEESKQKWQFWEEVVNSDDSKVGNRQWNHNRKLKGLGCNDGIIINLIRFGKHLTIWVAKCEFWVVMANWELHLLGGILFKQDPRMRAYPGH